MPLGQRHNGHRITAQACRVATQLRRGWRLEAGSLIDVLHLSAARACHRHIEFSITLIDQQHAMFAVLRNEGERVDIRTVRRGFNLDLLVTWSEIAMKQLEYPEARVRLPVIPIHHR